MTAMHFACEVLTFHRERLIPQDIVLKIKYPLAGPVYVPDWRDFMPTVVNIHDLFQPPFDNLRTLLITLIDHNVKYSHGHLRVAYLYLGGGLLLTESMNNASWSPSRSAEEFCAKLGECMNQASYIRACMLVPGCNFEQVNKDAQALGEKLAALCVDHRELHHHVCLQEGVGRLSMHVFKPVNSTPSPNVSSESLAADRTATRGARKSLDRRVEQPGEPWERRVRQHRGKTRGLAAEVLVRDEGPPGPPPSAPEGTDFGFLVSEISELGFLAQPESDWSRDPTWSQPWSDRFPPVWASF